MCVSFVQQDPQTTRPTLLYAGVAVGPAPSAGNAGVVGRGGRYRPAPKRDAEVLEETPNSNPNIAAAFATSHDLAVICLRSVLQELTKKRPGDGDKSVNKTWTSTLHNATNTRRRASCSHQAPHPGKCLTRTRITSTCGTRTQQTQHVFFRLGGHSRPGRLPSLAQRLFGYAGLRLAPGEEGSLAFELRPDEHLALADDTGRRMIRAGEYEVFFLGVGEEEAGGRRAARRTRPARRACAAPRAARCRGRRPGSRRAGRSGAACGAGGTRRRSGRTGGGAASPPAARSSLQAGREGGSGRLAKGRPRTRWEW